MIVTFWESHEKAWRSWLVRTFADGPAHHVTCSTDGMTLHTDPIRVAWYNTFKLYELYEGLYSPIARFEVSGNWMHDPKPPGTTWNAISWRFFGGAGGFQGCTQGVIDALRYNGHEVPNYVDPNHLMEWMNDCNWIKREGSYGKESLDPRTVYGSRAPRMGSPSSTVRRAAKERGGGEGIW